MAFRWFRKNKNATRWMYILVTVFVMVTFTVTGAMLDGLTDKSGSVLIGSFVTPGEETVEVKASEFRQLSYRIARLFGGRDTGDERTWRTLMMDARAKEAGIAVSDRMLRAHIRQQMSFASDAEFHAQLKALGVTPSDFESLMRQQIRISLYQRLNRNEPRVLSEQIFEQFQQDHELFQLEFVAFSDEQQALELDAAAVSEEDLKKFYEEDLDALRKNRDFSTPEMFGLDAALLSVEQSSVEDLREKLPEDGRELTEEELQSYYEEQIDRFELEQEEVEEAADEATDEPADEPLDEPVDEAADEPVDEAADEPVDEHAGHDHAPGEHPEEPEYQPLEEVRALLEKEILLSRVVNEAMANYRELKDAQESAEAEKQSPAEPTGDEADSNPSDAVVEGPEPAPEDLLKTIADKYGLELVDFGEPMEIGQVENLDRIGSDEILNLVRYQPEGNVIPREPTAEVPYGYLLRMKKRVPPEPRPFEEIKAELPEVWVEETAEQKSLELAEEFDEALTARARELVKDEVERIEKESREVAEERIESEGVTEEEAKQKILDEELANRKGEIDNLVAPRKGEVFVELAKERSLTVQTVDWFRKSYNRTRFYSDDEETAERFLKGGGQGVLFRMEGEGGIAGPMRYETGKLNLLVHLAGRKPPELKDMQLVDRVQAERLVQQQNNPLGAFPQFSGRVLADTRFEYSTLVAEMNLQIFSEENAPPEDDPEE